MPKLIEYVRAFLSSCAPDSYYLNRALKNGLKLGRCCRIYTRSLGGESYLVSIGDHVTLSKDVELITHDGGVWVFREDYPDLDVPGKIEIGNNVFVGAKSIVLPGSVIKDNVVVGAGSVVRGILESGWVYAGVPARKIRPLDEYLERCLNIGTHTKGLTESAKKAYVKERLNL